MNPPPDAGTHILVGANSFADAAAALRLIERVIHDLRPSLGGILVEETASLAVCDIPNQRVVSASGQVVLAPTRAQARTLIEADARAFQKSLARLAEMAGAPWSFQREIGDLIQKSLDTGAASDILVFAHRNIHPVAGHVVLVSSVLSAASKVSEVSRLLAQQLSADHMVMMVDESGTVEHQPADTGPGHFRTLKDAMFRLARVNAQAVLVDLSHGPVRSAEDLRHLIDVARCPVFVFGSAAAASRLEHAIHMPPAAPSDGTPE